MTPKVIVVVEKLKNAEEDWIVRGRTNKKIEGLVQGRTNKKIEGLVQGRTNKVEGLEQIRR